MILRLLCCCCACLALLTAAEPAAEPTVTDAAAASQETPPPPANSHRFTAGELRIYHYECSQQVVQKNLDDTLTFTSLLRWRFALRCAAVDATGADLVATIFLVQATHNGPGSQHSVDSSAAGDQDDPILGHLLAMNGKSLRIRWADGQVAQVSGGAGVVEALAGVGVDADRRRRAAAQAYSDEALLAFWRAALLEPQATAQTEPLAAPLNGTATRTWQAGAWTLSSDAPITATLATKPAPLTATISQLRGSGQVQIDDQGMLQQSHGRLTYRSSWQALGQPAQQEHELRWQLILTERRAPSGE